MSIKLLSKEEEVSVVFPKNNNRNAINHGRKWTLQHEKDLPFPAEEMTITVEFHDIVEDVVTARFCWAWKSPGEKCDISNMSFEDTSTSILDFIDELRRLGTLVFLDFEQEWRECLFLRNAFDCSLEIGNGNLSREPMLVFTIEGEVIKYVLEIDDDDDTRGEIAFYALAHPEEKFTCAREKILDCLQTRLYSY